jgi:hypothetical protein
MCFGRRSSSWHSVCQSPPPPSLSFSYHKAASDLIILTNIPNTTAVLTRSVHAVGVISIDFGTEWLKIGLVKRGVAADMVLNAESKRKTPIALALLDNERLFGNPAKSAVCIQSSSSLTTVV